MKGSEIMPLDNQLSHKSREDHLQLADEIIRNTFAHSLSYAELKMTLNRNGYAMKKDNVYIKGDSNPLLRLDREAYRQSLYNDRLIDANKFVLHTNEEANAIALLLYVNPKDIRLRNNEPRDDNAIRDMVKSFGKDKESLLEYFKENQLHIIGDGRNTLLVDLKNHTIANVTGLGIDNERKELQNSYDKNKDKIDDLTEQIVATSLLAGFLGVFNIEVTPEHDQKAKKKRKRKLNI
jgi:hypothetical protein